MITITIGDNEYVLREIMSDKFVIVDTKAFPDFRHVRYEEKLPMGTQFDPEAPSRLFVTHTYEAIRMQGKWYAYVPVNHESKENRLQEHHVREAGWVPVEVSVPENFAGYKPLEGIYPRPNRGKIFEKGNYIIAIDGFDNVNRGYSPMITLFIKDISILMEYAPWADKVTMYFPCRDVYAFNHFQKCLIF